MRIIEKKIWPEFFKVVRARKKNVELRLADFSVSKGDVLVLCEWDPKRKRYTGRSIRRKVKAVYRANMLKFHTAVELKKYGLLAIELS